MLEEQADISFVSSVVVSCALLGEMLDSFDHSIKHARLTHAQFHRIPEMYTYK